VLVLVDSKHPTRTAGAISSLRRFNSMTSQRTNCIQCPFLLVTALMKSTSSSTLVFRCLCCAKGKYQADAGNKAAALASFQRLKEVMPYGNYQPCWYAT
jgi:hypothetical protein